MSVSTELSDRFVEFFGDYYAEEIVELAAAYPDDQRSLVISRPNSLPI